MSWLPVSSRRKPGTSFSSKRVSGAICSIFAARSMACLGVNVTVEVRHHSSTVSRSAARAKPLQSFVVCFWVRYFMGPPPPRAGEWSG